MRRSGILFYALVGLLIAPAALCLQAPLAVGGEGEAAGKNKGKFSVVDTEGQHADILGADGKPLVRYVYKRDDSTKESAFDTAKVFAHVMAPGGKETLTSGPGGKVFPHHRGIFIGWNKIQHDGKSHDLWHVRDTVQKHKSLTHQSDDKSASITAEIDWIGRDGKSLIREKRTHRLVEDGHAYAVIDFTSELKAVAGDLVLDGDPEHAGIQFRPSQEVAENKSAKYTFHSEDVDPTKQTDLPWVACSFRIGGQDWTVQHISHPSNPSGARWSAYRDYGRFGEFPVIEIADGETQTLRYRFRITQGETPARQTLEQAAALFADQ